MILIGIDPGVNNGFAVYNPHTKKLIQVAALKTWEVLKRLSVERTEEYTVYIKDPTTWKPFKGSRNQSSKLKGAGSVTARFKAIQEFMDDHNIKYVCVPIQGNAKKMDAQLFKKVTGWEGQTNEHGRDAALLVFNR
jgi:D-alanine-D-alanine ligase-like ATP-grasp enzyme